MQIKNEETKNMEKTGEYLYSKIQPKNGEMKKEGSSALSDPIGNFEYAREGNVSVENEKLRLEFSYSFAEYHDYVRGPDEIEGLLGSSPLSNGYRKLNRFVVTDKTSNKTINILEELPEGYRILFNPFLGIESGSARVLDKGCVILGDISSIRGILTILHEIGHCVDYGKASDKYEWHRTHIESAINKEDLKSVLLKEMNAWEFALNKIKPLFKSGALPKDKILKNAYGKKGFFSYCEDARAALERMGLTQKLEDGIDIKGLDEFKSKLHELTGR